MEMAFGKQDHGYKFYRGQLSPWCDSTRAQIFIVGFGHRARYLYCTLHFLKMPDFSIIVANHTGLFWICFQWGRRCKGAEAQLQDCSWNPAECSFASTSTKIPSCLLIAKCIESLQFGWNKKLFGGYLRASFELGSLFQNSLMKLQPSLEVKSPRCGEHSFSLPEGWVRCGDGGSPTHALTALLCGASGSRCEHLTPPPGVSYPFFTAISSAHRINTLCFC